jgi:TldD protein
VTSTGTYRTPVGIDPFSVPADQKAALLLEADRAMQRVDGVKVTRGSIVSPKERKLFANTEGVFTEQEIVETGAGIVALAVDEDEVQQRSYPNSFGRDQRTLG